MIGFTRYTLIIFFFLIFTFSYKVTAQNPYASVGKTKEILSLSKGKFNEMIVNDSIIKIGSVFINLKAQKVLEFSKYDTMGGGHKIEPEVASRWWARDPQESKYVGYSPYHFAADNPLLIIDPNGEEWGISVQGNTITITFTGTLINDSGTPYTQEQLNSYAGRIKESMEAAYSGGWTSESGKVYTVKTEATINVLNEGDVLAKTDHAIRLTADGNMPGGNKNASGYSPNGGLVIYLNENLLANGAPQKDDEGNYTNGGLNNGMPTLERTAAHEAGHTAGLYHLLRQDPDDLIIQTDPVLGPFHQDTKKTAASPNLMHSSVSEGKPNPFAGFNLSNKQFGSMITRINDTKKGLTNREPSGLGVNRGKQEYDANYSNDTPVTK